jgi:hemerythrin superfamily protein
VWHIYGESEVSMAEQTNGGGADLIDLLLQDHQAAEALLGRIGQAGVDQSQLFDELVKDLVAHESAEEEVVYPVVRSSVEGGDALADARIKEQQKAEKLLANMEKMDRNGDEFHSSLATLRDEATKHAKAEEAEVFPPLKAAVDADRRRQLGSAYEAAKASAPSHPKASADRA